MHDTPSLVTGFAGKDDSGCMAHSMMSGPERRTIHMSHYKGGSLKASTFYIYAQATRWRERNLVFRSHYPFSAVASYDNSKRNQRCARDNSGRERCDVLSVRASDNSLAAKNPTLKRIPVIPSMRQILDFAILHGHYCETDLKRIGREMPLKSSGGQAWPGKEGGMDKLDQGDKVFKTVEDFVNTYVEDASKRRPIKKMLVATNGIAAVRCILSIRKLLMQLFRNDRIIKFICLTTEQEIRSNADNSSPQAPLCNLGLPLICTTEALIKASRPALPLGCVHGDPDGSFVGIVKPGAYPKIKSEDRKKRRRRP
ncbi:hypothetical protein OSTOST_04562 [Ostertagia ostertagi]